MENKKKIDERRYLDILKRNVDDFPQGRICACDPPDFLIHSGSDVLGIELTRIYKSPTRQGNILQATESERREIIDIARQLFEQKSGIKTTVSIIFSDSVVLSKSRRQTIGEQISNLILANIPEVDDWIQFDHESSTLDYPAEVLSIQVGRFHSLKRNSWQVFLADWIQEEYASEIQSRIDKKAGFLPKYLLKCNRCWLLIYSELSGGSAFFESSHEMMSHTYKSPFERTYLYEGLSQRVIRLKCE